MAFAASRAMPKGHVAVVSKVVSERAILIDQANWERNRVTQDTLVVDVDCSKGTYVRVLAEDIGKALGCGAHLAALRRTAVGPLTLDDAVELPVLEGMEIEARRACLRPII